MLKSIELKNFQIHKHLKIDFTDGLNVIIGESAQGKSSIIRALYLLFKNSPRAADKLYLRKGATKDSLYIKVEDDKGNIIERKKKKYYLNGIEYSAFRNEVPQPIAELFSFEDINWQTQLEPHFLILSTAGQASNQLSKITGLEEQKELTSDIKIKISETKSEKNRISLNIEEDELNIKKLSSVVDLLEQAKKTKIKQELLETNKNDIKIISSAVKRMKEINEEIKHGKHTLINEKKIEDVIFKLKHVGDYKKKKENLVGIIEEIKELDTNIDSNSVNKTEKQIMVTLEKLKEVNKINVNRDCLEGSISKIKRINVKEKEELLQELEYEIEETKQKLGICPLCGKEF